MNTNSANNNNKTLIMCYDTTEDLAFQGTGDYLVT